jgi:hypothetical protein
MSWVQFWLGDLAQRATFGEAMILAGLVMVMVVAIANPVLKGRRERDFRTRDDERRRLQNM